MDTETLKGIWDYDEGELDTSIAPKTGSTLFHLKVTGFETGAWDDGRPRVDLDAEIVCGELQGRRGPRVTLSLGATGGTTGEGREFKITEEDAWKRVVRIVRLLHPEPVTGFGEVLTDEEGLRDLGKVLVGAEFIARVGRDKNGYARVQRMFALTDQPKGYTDECRLAAFTLD